MSSIHPSNCFKGTYKSIAICKMKVFVVFLVCGRQASSNVTKSSVLGVLWNSIFAKNSIRLWDRYFPVNFAKIQEHFFYRTPLGDCFCIQLFYWEIELFARCSLLLDCCLLLFACCFLVFSRCSLLFALSLLLFYRFFVTFYSLLVIFCFLLVTFCLLLITFGSLLITFLLVARYFLLFAYCFLLVSRYVLLVARYIFVNCMYESVIKIEIK